MNLSRVRCEQLLLKVQNLIRDVERQGVRLNDDVETLSGDLDDINETSSELVVCLMFLCLVLLVLILVVLVIKSFFPQLCVKNGR